MKATVALKSCWKSVVKARGVAKTGIFLARGAVEHVHALDGFAVMAVRHGGLREQSGGCAGLAGGRVSG